MQDSSTSLALPITFLMTSIIPSVLFMAFELSSLLLGTLGVAILWFVAGAWRLQTPIRWGTRQWRDAGLVLSAMTLIFVHAVIVELWLGGVNFTRLAGSCGALLVMLIGAYALAARLLAASPELLTTTAHFAFAVLSIFGVCGMVDLPSVNGAAFHKPVIVFSEPSIFGFVYLPVFIFTLATTTRRRQLLTLASAVLMVVGLQNLTMLVGVLGASLLVLRRSQLLLVLAALILVASLVELDFAYYTSRLMISGDSDNLSTLVFLQGWQRAALNFAESCGLGIGFQQFGFVGSLGDIMQRIVQIVGSTQNLYDGGSTGSKLIAEFGVVGIFAILGYLALVARGVRLIVREQMIPPDRRDARAIFYYAYVIAFVIEIFIRGNGYLSPSVFILMATLIALSRLKASIQHKSDIAVDDPAVGSIDAELA